MPASGCFNFQTITHRGLVVWKKIQKEKRLAAYPNFDGLPTPQFSRARQNRRRRVPWRPPVSSVDERAEHGLDHDFDGRIIDALSLRQLGRDGFEIAITCRWRQRHRSLRMIASWLSDKRKMRLAMRAQLAPITFVAGLPINQTAPARTNRSRASPAHAPRPSTTTRPQRRFCAAASTFGRRASR